MYPGRKKYRAADYVTLTQLQSRLLNPGRIEYAGQKIGRKWKTMKYIYYIIAVMIVFSGLAAYGLFDTRMEVSKPYITVNDRIISEKEFERMMPRKPAYMNDEQFIDSVIDKQLLIQEAVRQGINREESFRQSVENFYEQSLIKILLDRKIDSFHVDVSNDEIEKYRLLMAYTFHITKLVYRTMAEYENAYSSGVEKIKSDFIDLSGDLKYIVMGLAPGQTSGPHTSKFGVFVYTLDRMEKSANPDAMKTFDIKKVSLYIRDKKREQLMSEWIAQIKKSAEIWRKK